MGLTWQCWMDPHLSAHLAFSRACFQVKTNLTFIQQSDLWQTRKTKPLKPPGLNFGSWLFGREMYEQPEGAGEVCSLHSVLFSIHHGYSIYNEGEWHETEWFALNCFLSSTERYTTFGVHKCVFVSRHSAFELLATLQTSVCQYPTEKRQWEDCCSLYISGCFMHFCTNVLTLPLPTLPPGFSYGPLSLFYSAPFGWAVVGWWRLAQCRYNSVRVVQPITTVHNRSKLFNAWNK